MNNKSIFSLISFFLLSLFFVPSASAGPTYVNIEIPKKCGAWNYKPSSSHHCAGTGRGKRVKAGTNGTFKCVGGDNGKGNLVIEMFNCPTVVFRTVNVTGNGFTTLHGVYADRRYTRCYKGCFLGAGGDNPNSINTKHYRIDGSRATVQPTSFCTGGSCDDPKPVIIWEP